MFVGIVMSAVGLMVWATFKHVHIDPGSQAIVAKLMIANACDISQLNSRISSNLGFEHLHSI